LEKTCPSAALSTTNPTCCPDANPGRRGGKPATNRLSYARRTCYLVSISCTYDYKKLIDTKLPIAVFHNTFSNSGPQNGHPKHILCNYYLRSSPSEPIIFHRDTHTWYSYQLVARIASSLFKYVHATENTKAPVRNRMWRMECGFIWTLILKLHRKKCWHNYFEMKIWWLSLLG
jgi:hypothetical protein